MVHAWMGDGANFKASHKVDWIAGLEKSVGSEDPSDVLKKANARFLKTKGVTRLIKILSLV